MASGQIGAAVRQFTRLFAGEGTLIGLDEAELLRRFAVRRDPAALEALVSRYGPMVLGVCRRVLGSGHDADDAFQATFLVLVKKARTIRDPNLVGPWLHGVAHRVAVRARANAAIRRSRERAGSVAEEAAMIGFEGSDVVDRAELRATLDEEVSRLPERFRRVVVLCYLDGLTHEQAALRLRCPVGTVRSRLSTARERLRGRLTRRGVGAALSAGAFATVLAAETARASVPAALAESTLSAGVAMMTTGAGAAAAGLVPAGVASLADGATTTMFLTKVKILGGIALAGALTAGVGGAAAMQLGAGGGGIGIAATDDPVDEIVAKLKRETEDRVRKSEAVAEELRREIAALKDEVARLRAQNKEQNANVERSNYSRNRAAQSTLGAGGSTSAGGEGVATTGGASLGGGAGSSAAFTGTTTAGGQEGSSGFGATTTSSAGGPGASTGTSIGGSGDSGAVNTTTSQSGAARAGGRGRSAAASGGGQGQTVNGRAGGLGGRGMGQAGAGFGGGGGGLGGSGMGGMMGGGGFGGGMGMMGMAGGRGVGIAEAGDYVLIQRLEEGKLIAANPETGESSTYDVPKGTTALPIVSGSIVAIAPQGEKINQIAVFSGQTGKWYPLDLKAPAEGQAMPTVGAGVVAYTIGNRLYAFSSKTKSWDTIEVEGGNNVAPLVDDRMVTAEHNGHLYLFNRMTGKWTDHKAGVLVTHKNRRFVFNTKTNEWTPLDPKPEGDSPTR